MVAIVVLFVGLSLAVVHTLHHGTVSTSPSTQHHHSGTTTTTVASTEHVVPLADVTVQVANGTTISGLAGTYTPKLQILGWNTLPKENGPHVTATKIYYHPGYLWAAQKIVGTLRVPSSSLHAMAPRGIVIGVQGSSADDVVVVLGPDVGK